MNVFPLPQLAGLKPRLLSTPQLRDHGVSPAQAAARCRPGGPWQALLPGVYLLHSGTPTSEERLHGALLYAGRPVIPAQAEHDTAPPYTNALITGMAALALYQFTSAPPLTSVEHIDVLVPRTRRLRSTGCARIVRTHSLPPAEEVTGLPIAPVARALTDAVRGLTDPIAVRLLLTEAVQDGHCDPASLVAELSRGRLLALPHVADAVDSLLAEGRSIAEERLYDLVRDYQLPDPLWNVDLRLPGGPQLGGVDVYWPDQAVAVELNTRAPREDEDATWSEHARKREHLERLGITVVHLTPRKLRDFPEQQAMVVQTALTAAGDRPPAAYVVVLPR
ncbi:hypothetical protein ACFQ61_35125 [Streptomyces sp. NPDC056500]|uniref:hypothetical protein n=1 Tax=Streptomyces sp. NPDC056500 TaxID=3345840 RepID=UPI0036C1F550